jgi:hypothetical protein
VSQGGELGVGCFAETVDATALDSYSLGVVDCDADAAALEVECSDLLFPSDHYYILKTATHSILKSINKIFFEISIPKIKL